MSKGYRFTTKGKDNYSRVLLFLHFGLTAYFLFRYRNGLFGTNGTFLECAIDQ